MISQAAALGIDPNPPHAHEGRSSIYPARSSACSAAGSSRGRKGDARSFRLDNRSTRLALGAPEQAMDLDAVRTHFDVSWHRCAERRLDSRAPLLTCARVRSPISNSALSWLLIERLDHLK